MCNFASFVCAKDYVSWSKNTDSHSEIIKEFGLYDHSERGLPTKLVPVEIVPPNNDILAPLDKWIFNIDDGMSDIYPEWWDKEKYEKMCRAEMVEQIKEKVVLPGQIFEETNRYIAVNGGTINDVRGGTIIDVRGGTINAVWGGTIIAVWGGTINDVRGGTINDVRGGTIIAVRGGTINDVWGGTINDVWGGTINDVWGGTIIDVNGGTINDVRGGTIIDVRGGTINDVRGGTIIAVRGGTINDVWDGTINDVRGGTINAVNGGTINAVRNNATVTNAQIDMVAPKDNAVIINRRGKKPKIIMAKAGLGKR